MTYNEMVKQSEQLSYRDKLRLAQHLIQSARKEEEEQKPEIRKTKSASSTEVIQYVAERLLKLRPSKKTRLLNSIGAMFQFQGGISEEDKEHILVELQRQRRITIAQNGRVSYPE